MSQRYQEVLEECAIISQYFTYKYAWFSTLDLYVTGYIPEKRKSWTL